MSCHRETDNEHSPGTHSSQAGHKVRMMKGSDEVTCRERHLFQRKESADQAGGCKRKGLAVGTRWLV